MNQAKISSRIASVGSSGTMETSEKIRMMRASGIDVIHFGGGDPDFDTPEHIRYALHAAVRDGFTHYTDGRGLLALREAIAEKLRVDNGIDVDPGDGIIVTPGGKHALFCAFAALLDAGDQAIVLDPSYVSYGPAVRLVGAEPVHVALDGREGFRIVEAVLEAAVTDRTRMLVLNSPNNPTGRVHDRAELDAIAAVACRHNLTVLSDEVYEKIVFDGLRAQSIGALPGMADRTITVNAFSKTYAMTGWRLGYLCGPARLVKEIFKVHQHTVTCAPSFTQKAAIAALRGPQDCVRQMAEAYERRRNRILAALADVPAVHCFRPEGTFYIFLDVSCLASSAAEFSRLLLEEAHVGVTPGTGFGQSCSTYVRIAFTQPDARIEEALIRMQKALRRLSASPAA